MRTDILKTNIIISCKLRPKDRNCKISDWCNNTFSCIWIIKILQLILINLSKPNFQGCSAFRNERLSGPPEFYLIGSIWLLSYSSSPYQLKLTLCWNPWWVDNLPLEQGLVMVVPLTHSQYSPRGPGWRNALVLQPEQRPRSCLFSFGVFGSCLPLFEEILERVAESSGSLCVLPSRLAPWHKVCHLLIRPRKLCLTDSGEKLNSAKENTSGSVWLVSTEKHWLNM